jgi:hypothetical protein
VTTAVARKTSGARKRRALRYRLYYLIQSISLSDVSRKAGSGAKQIPAASPADHASAEHPCFPQPASASRPGRSAVRIASSSSLWSYPLLGLGLGLALTGIASAQAAPPADPVQQAPTLPEPVGEKRVLGVLPNFRTVEDTGVYMPITAREKLTIATKDTLDFPLVIVGAGLAGLGQLTDSHEDFGQGVSGYARRWATSYADQLTGNYMTEGLMPILFHEDPRYFRRGRGRGGVWSRTFYAASRIFVTKTDSGGTSFNFAEVLGNAASAGIANSYYPNERTFGDNMGRLTTQLATDAVSQILKEFWPDIRRRFSHHRKDASPPPASRTPAQSAP